MASGIEHPAAESAAAALTATALAASRLPVSEPSVSEPSVSGPLGRVSRLAVSAVGGSRQEIIARLRERLREWGGDGGREGSAGDQDNGPGLERLLPRRGFPRGTLVEWLAEGEASGAGTLALLAAKSAAAAGGAMVVLDSRHRFYPPAAAALGVRLEQVIVVRADRWDDELWACDQALRCTGVAAVWGMLDRLPQRWFRRLQLAAERGGAIGHLLRPRRVRGRPSWAYAQLLVEPLPSVIPLAAASRRQAPCAGALQRIPPGEALARPLAAALSEVQNPADKNPADKSPADKSPADKMPARGRRWRVELIRCQGQASGGAVVVEFDDVAGAMREIFHETRPVPVVSPVADPASACRSAGA